MRSGQPNPETSLRAPERPGAPRAAFVPRLRDDEIVPAGQIAENFVDAEETCRDQIPGRFSATRERLNGPRSGLAVGYPSNLFHQAANDLDPFGDARSVGGLDPLLDPRSRAARDARGIYLVECEAEQVPEIPEQIGIGLDTHLHRVHSISQ